MQLRLLPFRAAFAVLNVVFPYWSAKFAQRLYTAPPRKARPFNPEEREFFEHAHAFTIPYPSHPMRAWRRGDPNGKRVLLVHGWGGQPRMYVALAKRLIDLGCETICYEAPGHGLHPEKYTSPMGFADSIRAALDAVGPVDAIVAHSIAGGATVMASKLGLKVDRLVLLAPYTRVVDHTGRFAAQLGISRRAIARMRQLVWQYAEPSSSGYGNDWDDLYEAPERYPALIVHDPHDSFMPFHNTEWLLRRWPHSTLLRTQGVTHGRIAGDVAVIKAVCRFITGREPTAHATAGGNPARPAKRKKGGNSINLTWLDSIRLHRRGSRFRSGWPARSRRGIDFYEVSQATIRARVSGSSADGNPVIVMVCDPPNVIEHFDALAARIEPHAKLVCFEPPGFGFSSPKPDFRFTFDAYRANIEEFLEKLGEGRYVLAFTCVWAHIALQIAARRPEMVARLMLWQAPSWEQQVKWAKYVDPNRVLSTPLVGQLAMALAPHRIGVSWHRRAMAKDRYPEFTPPLRDALDHGAFCCLGSLWQQFYGVVPPQVTVSQPVLVTWGTADRTHRRSEKLSLAAQVPHATWHNFFDDAGHSPELEASEEFAQLLLDWTTETKPGNAPEQARGTGGLGFPELSPSAV